jgi:tetratricopeptide (TPR) repeat protein
VPGSTPPVVSRSQVVDTATIGPPEGEPATPLASTDPPAVARPAVPSPALSAAMLAPAATGADAALFVEMVSMAEAGLDARSKDAMMRLVRDHPQSPLVPYAFAHLGDHFFARGELASARTTYRKATAFREADAVAYASYKLGWCGLLDQPADATAALEDFAKAIMAAATDAFSHSVHARTLRRAARIDLVTAYAVAGKPDKAGAFFDRIGKGPGAEDDRADMLRALANAYLGAGRRDDAMLVCRALLDRDLAAGGSCP